MGSFATNRGRHVYVHCAAKRHAYQIRASEQRNQDCSRSETIEEEMKRRRSDMSFRTMPFFKIVFAFVIAALVLWGPANVDGQRRGGGGGGARQVNRQATHTSI